MKRFKLQPSSIDSLYEVDRYHRADDRGFLDRLFCQEELNSILAGQTIRQINQTLTRQQGTVRGLHFQFPPKGEMKIITCLRGRVWDVAVDLRKNSPTFLNYHSVTLTEENRKSLVIPEGFAHGFQTLVPNCELLYFHTSDYAPDAEGALNALDASIGIQWPQPVTVRSKRDSNHPIIDKNFTGLELP